MRVGLRPVLVLLFLLYAVRSSAQVSGLPPGKVHVQRFPVGPELHLKNIRQLTFGGINLAPHVSSDGDMLVFEHWDTVSGSCPEIETMPISGGIPRVLLQRATSPRYFGNNILCVLDRAAGSCVLYSDSTWPTPAHTVLAVMDTSGTVLRQFDADTSVTDATISKDGDVIVFTAMRAEGSSLLIQHENSEPKTLLTYSGYIGGADISPNGRSILISASRPVAEEAKEFQAERALGYSYPKGVEIWILDTNGTHLHALTMMQRVCGEPCWTPQSSRILFGSNYNTLVPNDMKNPARELFTMNTSGSGFDQVTFSGGYNGFPTFTPDGDQIIFASNRNEPSKKQIDLFIADWVR